MDDFIKNGLNSKFSEEISKSLDIKINNNLRKKKLAKILLKEYLIPIHLIKLQIQKLLNLLLEVYIEVAYKF